MIVMKFGGTSIADVESVKRVTEIVRQYLKKKPIVVNSAIGKTTRNLLDTAQLSAGGQFKKAEKKLEEIHQYHFNLSNQLLSGNWHDRTIKIIEGYFEELTKLLGGISILRELTPKAQDKFLSYGELISTAIVSAALNASQIKSDLMDARKLVVTDDCFTGANPIKETTYKRIQQAIRPKIQTGSVPVVQGFIGSTRKGATTTLGFEGSDLTACLVGAAIKADDVQIWKDVSGIMTADPMMVPDARTVKTISFDEVGELTYFGAKVFYSRAVEPARQASIPIHVYNSKAPGKTGTEVTLKPKSCANLVKSIAYQSALLLVRIHPNQTISEDALGRSIFEYMDRLHIDAKICQLAKNGVMLVVEKSAPFESFFKKIHDLGDVTVQEGKATVSLVGENIRDRKDMPNRVIHILKDQSIDLISTGVSPINVTIVIDEKNLKSVISKLHGYFFKTVDPSVFE